MGLTMIPGIIEPHAHIYGGALNFASRFGVQYPPEGVTFIEAQADRDLEKTQGIMRDALQEAVKNVAPGDWIVLNMRSHPDAPRDLSTWGMTRRLTNRRTLDLWTPENPVLMRPGLRGNINSRALEVLNEFLPGYSASIQETMHGDVIGEDIPELGWVGSQEMAVITWELFLEKLDPNILAQMLKLRSEQFASLGSDHMGHPPSLPQSYDRLRQTGRTGPDADSSQCPLRGASDAHRPPTDSTTIPAHGSTSGPRRRLHVD